MRQRLKDRRYFSALVGLLGLLLAALILLQPALWANLVAPITQVCWVVLRVFLSLHQNIYWGLLIFAVAVYWYVRLIRELESGQAGEAQAAKNTLESMEHWRTMIGLTLHEARHPQNSLKQELAALLVAMAAAKRQAPASLELYEAFREGRIPLPPDTRRFLFPPELPKSGMTFGQLVRSLWHTPRRWLDRWTGREQAAYYQSIDEALRCMERFMEINDDDSTADPIIH